MEGAATRVAPAAKTRRPPGWIKRALLRYVAPELAFGLISLLRLSWRMRETGRANFESVLASGRTPVFGFLHGRTFLLLNTIAGQRDRRQFAMCSTSADGDAMARLEQRLGFDVIRGSSGRGGPQAIVDMVRAVRENPGSGAGLAVDGSRGPRGYVQGGIIALAQRTRGIVIPVTASASAGWIFRKSWDRTLIPKPFARIEVVFGELLHVPAQLTAPEFERLRAELEDRLVALQAHADELSGLADSVPVRAPRI